MQELKAGTDSAELQLCCLTFETLIYERCYKVFNRTENETRLNFFLLALELQSQHVTTDS